MPEPPAILFILSPALFLVEITGKPRIIIHNVAIGQPGQYGVLLPRFEEDMSDVVYNVRIVPDNPRKDVIV